MSFKNQFLTALYRFGSYPELFNVKGVKTFVYTALTVIITVAVMFAAVIPGYRSLGGIEGFVEKYIPEFRISEGELIMDKVDFRDEKNGVRIYINTDTTELDMSKIESGDVTALIASKDKMYVYNAIQGQEGTLSFKDLSQALNDSFESKSGILNYLGQKSVRLQLAAVFILILFIYRSVATVYEVFMLTLLGNLINTLMVRIPISFSQMFKLAAYARTLPWILSLLVNFVAGISFSSIIFFAVGSFYIYKALKNTKAQTGVVIADISRIQ